MKNGILYFHCPVGLWDTEPYSTARAKLGPDIIGTYMLVVEQIRLGNGTDSLDHILTIYDNEKNTFRRRACQRRLRRMLSPELNLFTVSPQRMVRIVNHPRHVIALNRQSLRNGPLLFNPDDL